MKKTLIAAVALVGLFAGGQASAIGLYDGYALAEGVVTEMDLSESAPSNSFCYISYEVVLDGQEFSGRNNGISDFCHLEVGDTILIKYLVSDVRKHEVASEFEVNNIRREEDGGLDVVSGFSWIMLLPVGIFVVLAGCIIIFALRQSKKMDLDGDGLAGDNKPATVEQKKLIREGFRKLGVHHEVKKKMTQAQARETLREIDRKLNK